MKRILVVFGILAFGLTLSVQAQNAAPAPAPAKVAVITFQAAVAQCNEFQRDFADLNKKFDPKREELKALAAEIESATKDLQAQGDKLAEAEQSRRQKAIEEKQKQAKRLQEDAQNDYQQELQQLFGRVAAKVGETLQQYAKDNGLTAVIDATPNPEQPPLVLWADRSTDITKAVVDAYNAKSGVPAPAAPLAK